MTYTYLAYLKDGQKPFNIEVMEDLCLNLKEIGHVYSQICSEALKTQIYSMCPYQ